MSYSNVQFENRNLKTSEFGYKRVKKERKLLNIFKKEEMSDEESDE